MYNRPISVTIKPILTRWDLENKFNKKKLKELPEFSDIDDSSIRVKELTEYVNILKSDDYLMSYGKIDSVNPSQYLTIDYDRPNTVRETLREELFKQKTKSYMDITFYVILFNDTDLEYRYLSNARSMKSLSYRSIFNDDLKRYLASLPMVNSVTIIKELDLSIKNIFKVLKTKYKDKSKYLFFLETLFEYGRNKVFRDNIGYRKFFDTFVILYKPLFIDKDPDIIQPDTYYELPNVKIQNQYIKEPIEVDNVFKKNDHLKCIGTLKQISRNRYEFKVKLRKLLDINTTDDLTLFCTLYPSYIGFNYIVNNHPEITVHPPGLMRLKIFSAEKYHLFKLKNIDKMNANDNPMLYLLKEQTMHKTSLQTFLKMDTIPPTTMLKQLTTPTELIRYNNFLSEETVGYGQGWTLPFSSPEVIQKGITNIRTMYKDFSKEDKFKYIIPLLFQTNTPFHFRPRDSFKETNRQYRLKLNEFTTQKEIPTDVNKKIRDELSILNPTYIVIVHLSLQKNDFVKNAYFPTCKETKYNLKKYTLKIQSGGNKLKNKTKNVKKTCSNRR